MIADLAAWLLTFAIHSTLLLAGVAVVVKLCGSRMTDQGREAAWKTASLGGVATSLVQRMLVFEPASGHLAILGAEAAPPPAVPAESMTPAAVAFEVARDVDVSAIVVAAASIGALLASLGLALRWVRITARLRDRRDAPVALRAQLDTVRRWIGVPSAVRLSVSERLDVPVVFGVQRAEICLPERALLDLDTARLRVVFAHELGHVRRRDPLWLRVFAVLEAVFPWQPLLRLARRRVSELSEYACDEWAARCAGEAATAECLVTIADWLTNERTGAVGASMAAHGSLLTRRVDRLLDGERGPFRPRGRALAMAAVVALAVSAVGLPGAAAALPDAGVGPVEPLDVAVDLNDLVDLLEVECGEVVDEFVDLKRDLVGRDLGAADRAALARVEQRVAQLRRQLNKLRSVVAAWVEETSGSSR